jgi:hypothetical protein
MQPHTMSYARTVIALAFMLAAAIFAWRISGAAATLLHDFHLHLQASMPHPAKLQAPKITSVPKLAPISCQ